MYKAIQEILSEIDNRAAFKPMVWRGAEGILKIPIIGTSVYDKETQIRYITTEKRPAIFQTNNGKVTLHTTDEICNDFRLLDNTQIDLLFLRKKCLWLSLRFAQAEYDAQWYKLYNELTDTNNANVVREALIAPEECIVIKHTVHAAFGYTYLLHSMSCKRKDIDVLVYRMGNGVGTEFTSSAVFLSTNAPKKAYKVYSSFCEPMYLVCPVIDNVPLLSSLIVKNEKDIQQQFANV